MIFTQEDLDCALADLEDARKERFAVDPANRPAVVAVNARVRDAELLVLGLRQAIGRQNIQEAARILGAKVVP